MDRQNAHQNYKTDTPYSYDIVFSSPTPTHNRYENPVRDNQKMLMLKKEEQYKDHYGVSDFKFADVATARSHTNHANYCELTFDGTKSTKHHHRKKNTIKRVTSTTTVNCSAKKKTSDLDVEVEEYRHHHHEKQVTEEKIKDTTFHHLAEQFKNKLKFIEMPVKLHKHHVVCNKDEGNRFEVILSPKTPASYSSIETMSNLLKSAEHRHKKIILTSNTFHPAQRNRPDMRDREIQTAIIGIRNFHNKDECFNMRLASVNDILYNMDLLPSNEDDLFNLKQKKHEKVNLTVTHFPCLEIKCSSIFFEMPANSVRTPMPRRTLNTSNVIIDDYHEASATLDEKVSEPTETINSSETPDPLKDKILNLLGGTQIATSADYNKKVNELCDLIGSLLSENTNKYNKNQKKSVKRPTDMYINIKRIKADSSSSKRKIALTVPPYSLPKTTSYCASVSSASEKSCNSTSNAQIRSRSISPPSRPSTPSCQISKVPAGESYETSPRDQDKCYSKTSPNLQKFSLTSIPSISSISNGSHHFKMVFKASGDNVTKQKEPFCAPVPRDVFIIPPHVNQLLKNYDYTSNARREYSGKSANIAKPPDFRLVNILKKPQTKQSWVVPDIPGKFQTKCDVVNHFQCMESTKSKKSEHDYIGPSVTFSSMVDVFGGENDNESLEEQLMSTTPQINTIVPVIGLPKSRTAPNKIDSYAMNDDEDSPQNSSGAFLGRQFDNKPKTNYEKQASFYNSSFFSLKKDTTTATSSCLQKRKEYDYKLKMQMQSKQQPSKIPLAKTNTEQDNVETTQNQTCRTGKSKLPLKITNEVTSNKQSFVRNQMPETSRLYTTDINKNTAFAQLKAEFLSKKPDTSHLNTPRSAKNTRMIIQNNLNVTKDITQKIQKRKSSL